MLCDHTSMLPKLTQTNIVFDENNPSIFLERNQGLERGERIKSFLMCPQSYIRGSSKFVFVFRMCLGSAYFAKIENFLLKIL